MDDDHEDASSRFEDPLTRAFSEIDSRSLWGDILDASPPEATIKTVPLAGPPAAVSAGANQTQTDSSVVFTRYGDGSATMSLPGANVTLSPKRTSTITGQRDYEIGEVIGKGGMGVVHVARQASLDRRIVVKTIRPDLERRIDAQEKFITEALATGTLDHPNVVPVHDMGVTEDGRLFYVMKEVRGRTWRDAMKELDEAENIDILQRVADAVACAHDKGVIHRDLKPDNVMLGDYGEVLLMDWGLAAAVSPTAKAAQLTPANACAGTPNFMAPEMARGLAHEIGPWSDQYLLGAILYTILTGKPPHPGKRSVDVIRDAANNLIAETDRSDELVNVALRAMSTLPARRFPSVKAFQKAVRNYQIHAESIALSKEGDALLDKAAASGGYDEFSRAIFAFEQALALWSKNDHASAGLATGGLAYARRAFAKGDYDLALSLLANRGGEEAAELGERARRERRLREARRRRVKTLGALAAAALILVALVSIGAYVIVSRQAEAEHLAREEAEEQQKIAEEQRAIAEAQRSEADSQRNKAEAALIAAEEARRAEAEAQELRLKDQEAKLAAQETARREAENARRRAEEALRAREEIQRLGYLEDNSRWRFDADEAIRRQEEAAGRFALPARESVVAGGAEFAFALVPPGEFVMGSPPRDPSRNNDEYLHEVSLSKPFQLMTAEVTRSQWQTVVGIEKAADFPPPASEEEYLTRAWRFKAAPEGEAALPASGVSFEDIHRLFLPRLAGDAPAGRTFRLPTEAEWEWAARAGATGHYYNGDTEADLREAGWYEWNSEGVRHPVGRKLANAWGLYDMLGNLAELTMDSYDALFYLRSPRIDPVNLDPAVRHKVCRGGSFVNSPRLCRLSNRSSMHAANRYPHAGFRLALAADAPEWEETTLEKAE